MSKSEILLHYIFLEEHKRRCLRIAIHLLLIFLNFKFCLQLYNSKDSTDGNRVKLAINTMAYLSNKEFCCPQPVRNRHGKLVHLEKVSCNEGNTGVEGTSAGFGFTSLLIISWQVFDTEMVLIYCKRCYFCVITFLRWATPK